MACVKALRGISKTKIKDKDKDLDSVRDQGWFKRLLKKRKAA